MKDVLAQKHDGERIIPSVENAALMGWSLKDLAEAVVVPLEAGLGGATLKPSKRELLEQILAEQRKMNELLGTINSALMAVTEGGNAMRVEGIGA